MGQGWVDDSYLICSEMTSPRHHSLEQWNQICTAKHAHHMFWFLGPSEKSPRWILIACFSSRVFDDGRCILNCPTSKFELKKQCHPCHHTCQECQGSGPSNCTSCRAGEGNHCWLFPHLVLFSHKLAFGLAQKPCDGADVQSRQLFVTAQYNLKALLLPGHKKPCSHNHTCWFTAPKEMSKVKRGLPGETRGKTI